MNFKLVNENIDDFYLTNQQQHDIVPLSESSEPQKSSTSPPPIDCQDLCIQEHKNGLFVISLSPKHSLSGSCSELKVHQVEFPLRPTPPAVLVNGSGMNEGDDLVETSNKQTNPSASSQQLQKKKEIKVQPHTIIARIYYHQQFVKSDGGGGGEEEEEGILQIRSNVKGKLVEINERLLTEPTLCQTHPYNFGFLVIIDPNDAIKNLKQKQELMKHWKTRREYFIGDGSTLLQQQPLQDLDQ